MSIATFVIVYLQYFALFTVFGGTTPWHDAARLARRQLFPAKLRRRARCCGAAWVICFRLGTFFMGFLYGPCGMKMP